MSTNPIIPPLPDRPDNAHKGTFGTVIIMGGSHTMIGAPALAARAALRCGVGLVKLACPASVLPQVLTIEPGATGIALPELHQPHEPGDVAAIIEARDPEHKAVLAIGPGLGEEAAVASRVAALLGMPGAVVLDADGLNALARSGQALRRTAPTVLTPHPGEFRRLAQAAGIAHDPVDPAQREDAAHALANHHHAVVLLKGRHTVVSDGQQAFTNTTGNPAMATAGSGDVLTGLIAGLIAQGMTAYDAACLGAHLHGLAGDAWAKTHGLSGLRAQELADELPDVMQRLRG